MTQLGNKVAKDFPCKKCTHLADKHYASICDGSNICFSCLTGEFIENPEECWHTFEGDNLKYMELQIKKQELRNE